MECSIPGEQFIRSRLFCYLGSSWPLLPQGLCIHRDFSEKATSTHTHNDKDITEAVRETKNVIYVVTCLNRLIQGRDSVPDGSRRLPRDTGPPSER